MGRPLVVGPFLFPKLALQITNNKQQMDIIIFLAIGGVAGWIAGHLMQGKGFGLIGNIILGVIGGVIGGWLFNFLDVQIENGLIGSIITAAVGAIILVWLARFVKK